MARQVLDSGARVSPQNAAKARATYVAKNAPRIAAQKAEYARQQAAGNTAYTQYDAFRDYVEGRLNPAAYSAPTVSLPAVRTSSGGGSSRGSSGRSYSGGRSYTVRRGGGGGGGGGLTAQQKAERQKQLNFLTSLLNSRLVKFTPDNALRDRIKKAVAADRAAAKAAYDQAAKQLAQIQAVNPYANLRAQSAARAVDASLMSLLASQGASGIDLMAQTDALNRMADAAAANWNNAYRAQSAARDQSVQSGNAELAQARTFADRELAAQLNAMLMAAEQRDAQEKARREQLALEIIQQMPALIEGTGLDLPTLAQLGIA